MQTFNEKPSISRENRLIDYFEMHRDTYNQNKFLIVLIDKWYALNLFLTLKNMVYVHYDFLPFHSCQQALIVYKISL